MGNHGFYLYNYWVHSLSTMCIKMDCRWREQAAHRQKSTLAYRSTYVYLILPTYVYLCLRIHLSTYVYLCLPTSTYVNLCLPNSTYVYLCLSNSTYVYLCLPMSTYVYLCLPMSTYVYLCLPVSTCVYLCLPMSTYVYLCLPMSTYVYLCLPMSTYVYLCLPMSTYVYLCLPMSTYVYLCLPMLMAYTFSIHGTRCWPAPSIWLYIQLASHTMCYVYAQSMQPNGQSWNQGMQAMPQSQHSQAWSSTRGIPKRGTLPWPLTFDLPRWGHKWPAWDTAQHGMKGLGGVRVLVGAQALSGTARELSAVMGLSWTRGPCESPGSDLIMIKPPTVLFLLLSLYVLFWIRWEQWKNRTTVLECRYLRMLCSCSRKYV